MKKNVDIKNLLIQKIVWTKILKLHDIKKYAFP